MKRVAFVILVIIGLACTSPQPTSGPDAKVPTDSTAATSKNATEPTTPSTPMPTPGSTTIAGLAPVTTASPSEPTATQVPTATPVPVPTPTPRPEARFEIGSLTVTPDQLVAGERTTVKAEVANTGNAPGTYRAVFSIDGKEIQAEELSVSAGDKQTVSFNHVFETPGAVDLAIGGAGGNVKVLKPAELRVLGLSVTPPVVFPEKEATVTAEIANVGEAPGELLVSMEVDGVEADNRPQLLNPGASGPVTFTVVKDTPGTYEISVGGISIPLTVPELATYKSPEFPYSISYPADWTLDVDETDVNRITIHAQGMQVDVTTVTELPGKSVDVFLDEFLQGLKARNPSYRVSSQTPIEQDGEVIGYQFEAVFTTDGKRIRSVTTFSKKGSWLWVAIAKSPAARFEIDKPLLQSVLDSFVPPVMAVGSYTNTTEGFALNIPVGWDGYETGETFSFLELESPRDGPLVTVDLDVIHLNETLPARDIALIRARNSAESLSGFRILSQGAVALGSQTQGYEIVYTGTYGGGIVLKEKEVVVVRGSQVFIVWAIAEESNFDSQSGSIDRLMSSFTLQEPLQFGVSRQDSLFLAGGTILTLDPVKYRGGADGHVGSIFSGLVALDRDLKVIPDLAEKWEVSEGGTVYTFHLRQGLRFHNGKAVTARDVKYSWERAADPATESPTAATYLGDIVGVNAKLDGTAKQVSGIEVIDDITLRVTIDGPKQYFLQKLTYPTSYVVDRVNVQSGKTWTKRPNGTGPFKLKEWKEDELLILERNDRYYRGVAKLAHVVFQLFAGRAMAMYENGEIDVTGVGLGNIDRVLDTANPLNRELLFTENLCTSYLAFNPTKPPFDDPKVRQALALTLDVDRWIEVTLQDTSQRAAGILPAGMPGFQQGLTPAIFDVEKAKQLIAESKYGSIEDLPPITTPGVSSALLAMWAQNLGLQVQSIDIEDPQEYRDRRDNREFMLSQSGWCADYPDPENFLGILFQSDSIQNHFGYSNPEVDLALDEAAVEPDEAARMALYQEIERTILDDWVVIPLTHSNDYVLVKPYVQGYFLTPMGIHVLKDLSIARN